MDKEQQAARRSASPANKRLQTAWPALLLLTTAVFSLARVTDTAAAGREKIQIQETAVPPEAAAATPTLLPTPSQTPDKYYADYFAHSWDIPEEAAQGNTFWIEVNLSAQTLSAYRGNQIINTFLISSGTESFKTVTGAYRIYAKYSQYTMRGPGYDLPDVPYSMFFYKGYSIHGTYWHHNFGTPMSRGCVNMKTEDAAWVYENAPVGTYVFVHY